MYQKIKRAEGRVLEILLVIGGLIVGAGGTFLITQQKPESEKVSQAQQEVIKQLTDLDVIKELCAPEVITNEESRLLCREMTCLVYSRGIDSQTSGSSCEEISNIANTISMVNYCRDNSSEGSLCYEIFWRRK